MVSSQEAKSHSLEITFLGIWLLVLQTEQIVVKFYLSQPADERDADACSS